MKQLVCLDGIVRMGMYLITNLVSFYSFRTSDGFVMTTKYQITKIFYHENICYMKEQMEVMMNALKGRVSSDFDDLVNRTDSPFTIQVNSCPLPQKFRMPQVESYDRVKDPLDHLETFKTMMHL